MRAGRTLSSWAWATARRRSPPPWVRWIFKRYRNDYGILLAHDYLHPKKGIYGGGKTLYSEVTAKCENIRLILCGHYRGTWYREDFFDDDGDSVPERRVQTMLCNYQTYKKNGGQIRILTFDPAEEQIHTYTFSTVTGHRMQDDYFKNERFTISY